MFTELQGRKLSESDLKTALALNETNCGPGAVNATADQEPSMQPDWYIKNAGQEQGPFTLNELIQKSRTGEISLSTLVRKGNNSWSRADRFRNLFNLDASKSTFQKKPATFWLLLESVVIVSCLLILPIAMPNSLLSSLILPLVVIVCFVLIYFLPAYVATNRNHHQKNAILVLNLLFGWTFIGWALALVWAFTAVSNNNK